MTDEVEHAGSQRDRLLELLRAHGVVFSELGRAFGTRMDLHLTDANALVAILEAQDHGAPLTQAELSRRIGLTPGATSSLLNRLESVGHVHRVRNSHDRRVVTLQATDGVESQIDSYFDPLGERIGNLLPGYSSETLSEFERFLTELCTTMNDYVHEPPTLTTGPG